MSYYMTVASKINVPNSLLGLFNGESDLYMQNNSFPVVKIATSNNQTLFGYKEIKGKSKTGSSFIPPKIFIKNDKGEFTQRYKIELTNRLKRKETYRFKTPPMDAYPKSQGKLKNTISTKIMEDEGQIDALVKIDNIICMGLEFLMLATLSKYDFKDVKNDKELIEGLFKSISPKHYDELIKLLDENYYKLPSEPPVWEKSGSTPGNFTIPNENKKYLSLFNVITGTDIHLTKKNLTELQNDIIKNMFGGDRKTNPYYTFICSAGTENNIVPSVKKYLFESTDGEQKEYKDMRLLFYVKYDNESYNPKFPENMYVKKLLRGGTSEILNGDEFSNMIGITDFDPTKQNLYDGFLWITNRIDLTKYGQYQVHSSWLVNELILNKSTTSYSTEFKVSDDYYNDIDDSNDIEKTATESCQVIPSASSIPDLDDTEL